MKRIPFTYSRLFALTVLLGLCLLLFLMIQMRLVERQLAGLALGYFSDNARTSIQNVQENIGRLARDGASIPDSALVDEMLFLLESSHAGYVLVLPGHNRAELIEGESGVRVSMTEEGEGKVSYGISEVGGTGAASGGLDVEELKELTSTMRANLMLVLPAADTTPVIDLMRTPEGKRFVMLHVRSTAGSEPVTVCLLFLPEKFLNRLVAPIPMQMTAALLQQDRVIAVSAGAGKAFRELAGNDMRGVNLVDLLEKVGPAGELDHVETVTEEMNSGLRVIFISQGMGLLKGLLTTPLFLSSVGGFVVVLVALVLAISRYLTRHRRYYRPEVKVDADFVRKLIRQGEGMHVEFKSTLRQNLLSGKRDKSMEIAVLKGMCAFMNTSGGTMIVGVGDSGEVLGLEPDEFQSEDHALRHLGNVFNECVGPRHFNCVSLHACKLDGKQLLVALCRQSTYPVFIRYQSTEHFYVRQGPSNRSLSIGEFWEISDKFKR
ncbi:AlbA family DNA-binding domain-containing protein [Desulfovibrio subterraneus]|jgi:hypothetical protein|uniref:Schlafen AlbA-2 domain-containing protein n=1 Tax=Desulfovibrio subterraneus TaxID=2718620 RepID=A0A7J0BDI2_9BACT|nr:ATP-binding protein [Desulfovibrio subterraneus]GFM31749.1 hypothetical protein DSM101010T_01140 [Desulfovibrio subterraneus]